TAGRARLSSRSRVVGGPVIAQCTIGSTACLYSVDLGMNVPVMPRIVCAATRICSDPLPCYSRLINFRPCQLSHRSCITGPYGVLLAAFALGADEAPVVHNCFLRLV